MHHVDKKSFGPLDPTISMVVVKRQRPGNVVLQHFIKVSVLLSICLTVGLYIFLASQEVSVGCCPH